MIYSRYGFLFLMITNLYVTLSGSFTTLPSNGQEVIKTFCRKHKNKMFDKMFMGISNKYCEVDRNLIFSGQSIFNIQDANRKSLGRVNDWNEGDPYSGSLCRYGVPGYIENKLNRDVGLDLTYSDIMVFLSSFLERKTTYLELGVSLGKNFIQMCDGFSGGTVVGFEIEKMSPALQKVLNYRRTIKEAPSFVGANAKAYTMMNEDGILDGYNIDKQTLQSFALGERSPKYDNFSYKEYFLSGGCKNIYYLNGDLFDENCWNVISNKKFNMVFSDAFHSPYGAAWELMQLDRNDMLDRDEFVVVWDDLGNDVTMDNDIADTNNGMNDVFFKGWENMCKKFGSDVISMFVFVRGWLGENEVPHMIGITIKSSSFRDYVCCKLNNCSIEHEG